MQKTLAQMEQSKNEITLRRFDLSDADDYMVWASDEKVTQFCSWDTFASRDDVVRYMAESVVPHPWMRAVCLSGRPVGYILFTRATGGDRCRGEIGYGLASGQWGKGIATEAVRLAVAALFGEFEGLERVEAVVDVENVGSQRVLEKAGFTREGLLRKYFILKGRTRDMFMFSLLSSTEMHSASLH